MQTDIETTVRDVIGRVARLDVSSLGRDDDLVEHLGVDSLQGLQILAGIEKRFDVRLPDDELITLRTIGRIVEAVHKLGVRNVSQSIRTANFKAWRHQAFREFLKSSEVREALRGLLTRVLSGAFYADRSDRDERCAGA